MSWSRRSRSGDEKWWLLLLFVLGLGFMAFSVAVTLAAVVADAGSRIRFPIDSSTPVATSANHSDAHINGAPSRLAREYRINHTRTTYGQRSEGSGNIDTYRASDKHAHAHTHARATSDDHPIRGAAEGRLRRDTVLDGHRACAR